MKRLTVLGLLTLLLFGCRFPMAQVFIINESSYDIFYKIRTKDGYRVEGKRIIGVMGTLKQGESKSLTNGRHNLNIVGPFYSVPLEISMNNKSYEVDVSLEADSGYDSSSTRSFIFTDSKIQSIEDDFLSDPDIDIWFDNFLFSPRNYSLTAENFYGYNAPPYYNIEDFYVLLDDVIYLADISERKLVKVE